MINLKGRIMEIFNNLYENLYLYNLVELFKIYIYIYIRWFFEKYYSQIAVIGHARPSSLASLDVHYRRRLFGDKLLWKAIISQAER